MGGGQVLELVDQEDRGDRAGDPAGLVVGQEAFDGLDDLLVEVEGVAPVQLGTVLLEDLREPGDVATIGLFDLGRVPEAETAGR